MSTNAVLCLTDGTRTIRLTRYGCKPTVLLRQLVSALTAAGGVDVADVEAGVTGRGL